MKRTNLMKCSKCFHTLPPGKRTWRPYWGLWAECDGKRWTYAADGPPLGYLIFFGPEPARTGMRSVPAKPAHWAAYAVECNPETKEGAWPGWIEVGQSKTSKAAKKIVEDYISKNRFWSNR